MSFASKLIVSEGGEVRVLTAREDNRDAWFVLKLNPQSYSEYKATTRSGSGNIRDYGIIMESGWGKLTESEINALKTKYRTA